MGEPRKGYAVTVAGQYYAGNGRDKSLRTFAPEVFYIPETVEIVNGRKFIEKVVNGQKTKVSVDNKQIVNGLKAAQHIIQRRFLSTRLSEKYPDYTNFRECRIIDTKSCIIPEDALIDVSNKPIKSMTLPELKVLCAMESLSTQPGAYASLDDARAVVEAEMNAAKKPTAPIPVSEPVGVTVSDGPVTSEDGVPVDNEDPAADLM